MNKTKALRNIFEAQYGFDKANRGSEIYKINWRKYRKTKSAKVSKNGNSRIKKRGKK